MDLSKAFDTLPHDLITAKFKSYGADDKTTIPIHDYLTNRRQRVRLGDHLSNKCRTVNCLIKWAYHHLRISDSQK